MEKAKQTDINEIVELYRLVIDTVNTTDIKLGWNINLYPDESFVKEAIVNEEMYVIREDNVIVAVAAINHNVNPEYDDIDWAIKGPKENIATIHALTTHPAYRGHNTSDRLLKEIEELCKQNGDKSIHLDVIDTNIPAYKLYIRNGYTEVDCIKMYYEVVGTREFWMMEKCL